MFIHERILPAITHIPDIVSSSVPTTSYSEAQLMYLNGSLEVARRISADEIGKRIFSHRITNTAHDGFVNRHLIAINLEEPPYGIRVRPIDGDPEIIEVMGYRTHHGQVARDAEVYQGNRLSAPCTFRAILSTHHITPINIGVLLDSLYAHRIEGRDPDLLDYLSRRVIETQTRISDTHVTVEGSQWNFGSPTTHRFVHPWRIIRQGHVPTMLFLEK